MKLLELFNRLTGVIGLLLGLVLVLMSLMLFELLLPDSAVTQFMHPIQIGFSLLLLGLGLWVMKLKRELELVSQAETAVLNKKIASKTTDLQSVTQQMHDLIEVSPDLVWVKDVNGIYLSCNLPFEQYMATPRELIVGKTDFDLSTPEHAEHYRANDRQAIAARKPLATEEWHTPAQGGKPSLFEIIKTPVWDAAGNLTGVQGIGRDITLRRAAENALKKTEDQRRMLELCIAKLSEVVVITQVLPFEVPHPRIVFVNDAFERMTGYSRSEVLGKSPSLLRGPLTQLSELERINQALSQWQPVHAELIYYKKNGEHSWSEIDIAQVVGDIGWFRISVQHDISERKLAESSMLELLERAQESSRLKSAFLSGISHEMRTPMNAVIGLGQLLQDTELTSQQSMFVNHIVNSAQDYMQVIEKALDFSIIDSGHMGIEKRAFALRVVVQSLESQIAPKAQAKKLALCCSVDPVVPEELLGDERRLRQCLQILLDNAVKFTTTGRIDLLVSAVTADAETQASLRFEVRDTGIGLTDSVRERLFYPFVQGDGSMTRQYGGIGLGLVIWRNLVTLMHGRMGVLSTPGQGSTFWFELPQKAA
jgi:PAS domain S-box-containing protein